MREIAQKLSRCSSFGALMDDAFARCPEREAIVYEDWRLTYGDLERYIHQTAHYLRHLGVRKGSYDLISAIAELEPAVRDLLHVTLAGDGEVTQVRAAAEPLGAAVTVRDWAGPAERDELLAAAEVLALPSYDEGLPMALLEAMAAGLVPLTTPVGGIPEAITDGVNGLLIPPGDVPALASAFTRLVEDPALRTALSDGARTRAGETCADCTRISAAASGKACR